MKSSVAPPQVAFPLPLSSQRHDLRLVQITDTEARRRHLKKLSDERVKHWPNTLEVEVLSYCKSGPSTGLPDTSTVTP